MRRELILIAITTALAVSAWGIQREIRASAESASVAVRLAAMELAISKQEAESIRMRESIDRLRDVLAPPAKR
jgi:hypothetical protein